MVWPVLIGFLTVVAVADVLGFLLWYSCSWPRSQVLGPALVHGPTSSNRIAISFDDGPSPPYTEHVLDILRSRNVTATFFVCGKNAERHPDIVRRIHTDGHTIGNHTWSHPYLYFMGRAKIADEIDRTQKAIHQTTGCTPVLFRPPYGARWFGLYPLLRSRGMHLVQWSVNGNDWKLEARAIIEAVCADLRPGAVILLHDGTQKSGSYLRALFGDNSWATNTESRPPGPGQNAVDASETVKALPAIIDAALAKGYEFVSVKNFLCDVR